MVRGSKLVSGTRGNRKIKQIAIATAAAVVGGAGLLTRYASAASATWTGATDNTWAGANWSATPVPGAGDTATFNDTAADVLNHTTIDLGTGVTVGAILFDTNAAAYTIGNGSTGSQTLTLNTVGNAVTMNSTVTNNETIASAIVLSSNTSTGYTFTNNAASNTLFINGPISASVAGVDVIFSGSGNTTVAGALNSGTGSISLTMLGTGTLTLSGGGTFNAQVAQDPAANKFGADLYGGTTQISSGAYTSANEFVIGGASVTGVNTNLTLNGGSLTVNNWLSLGRGNGNGGVSSSIVENNSAAITSTNFSAGFNAGLSGPTGSMTLNNSSSYTLSSGGAFNLAESAGSNMTMTLNNSSVASLLGNNTGGRFIGENGTGTLNINGTASFINAGTTNMTVGYESGTGLLNISGGTFNNSAGELRVGGSPANGTFTGSGTLIMTGGAATVGALTVSRGNSNTYLGSGTVNISGGTLTSISDIILGYAGNGTGSGDVGRLIISGTGTVNVGTTVTKWLQVGEYDTAHGDIEISGGTLNLNTNSAIRFDTGNGTGADVVNQTGGHIIFYSDNATTIGGTGVLDMQQGGAAASNDTYNLSGGTLTVPQIVSNLRTGTRTFNFNGGILQSAASSLSASFMNSGIATTANVRNGGAIIDTNGNAVTIGQKLSHSTISGDNAIDGGLKVLSNVGGGSLTLSGANTFTGPTNIASGATFTAGISSTATSGALGVGSDVTVSGTLNVAGFNLSIGSLTGAGAVSLGAGELNILGSTFVPAYTGTMTGTTGSSIFIGSPSTLTFGGTSAIPSGTALTNNGVLNLAAAATVANLNGSSTSAVINTNGNAITVNNGGTYAGVITNGTGGTGSLTLNGGTLTLQGSSSYTGGTNVSAGTLVIDHSGSNTGALGNTPVTVSTGATLQVKGNTTIGSSTAATLTSTGTLSLQDLTINTLSLGGGLNLNNDVLKIDIGTGTADQINSGDIANLSSANSTAVNINLLAGQTVQNGQYTIITASGGLFAAGGPYGDQYFTVGSRPAGFNQYSFANSSNTALVLTITGNAIVNGAEYWTGAASRTVSDSFNKWSDAANSSTQSNWSTDLAGTVDPLQVPGSTSDVIFTATNANGVGGVVTTQLDSSYSIRSLTFNVPASTSLTSAVVNTNANLLAIGSNGVTLAAASNASGLISGTGSVGLSANQNWANNNNALPLNVSSGISAISAGTTLTLNGTGTGGIFLGSISDGTGTLALSFGQAGTTALTGAVNISGGLTVNSGTVVANASNTYGGNLSVTGGNLTFNSSSSFLSGGASIGNANVSFGGVTTINGGLTVNSGSVNFNASNAITGGVNINGGVVRFTNGGRFNATTPQVLTFGTAGDLQVNGSPIAISNLTDGGVGPIVENAGASNGSFTDNLATGPVTLNTLFQDGTGGGTLSVNFNGSGTVVLNSSNTYSGATNITGGAIVQINSPNNIGNASSASNVINMAGTLEITNTSNFTLVPNRAITLSGNSALQIDSNTASVAVQGNVSTGTSSLTVSGSGNSAFTGNITGGGSIVVTSTGTTTFSGFNTYTGPTFINNGNGLAQVSGGTLGTLATTDVPDIQIGSASGLSGTLNVSAGVVNADRVILGGNQGNTDGGTGTLNQLGGTINSNRWFTVGSFSATGVGTYNLSGGTLNIFTQQMEIGNFAGTNGTVNMSGSSSQINLYNSSGISLLANGGANGVFNQTGGTVSFYSDGGTTLGGTGSLRVGNTGAGNATYNLAGGTLKVPSIGHGGTGTGTFVFNGGTLVPLSSSTSFLSVTNAIVELGGANIAVPAGLTPIINQALVHYAFSPNNNDGGLNVSGGAGSSLTLTSTTNNYNGGTNISSGTLRLVGATAPIVAYNFAPSSVSGNTVTNLGVGGSAMNGTLFLNGGTGSIVTSGGSGTLNSGYLNFNGDGSTMNVPSGVMTMNNTNAWTVSVWVKTSTAGFSILNKGTVNSSGGLANWTTGNTTFYLNNGGSASGSGGVPAVVRNSGGWLSGSTTPAVNDGVWHMLTYVTNGSSASETVYVDGNAESTTSQQLTNADVGNMLRFGLAGVGQGDGTVNGSGSIGAVNMYGGALSSAQVASLYASNVAGTPTTNDMLYNGIAAGPMSLSSSTSVLDLEGANQHVGSLNGAAGSSVILGSGSVLTVINTNPLTNSSVNSEFDGSLNGSGGLTVTNPGVFKLGGNAVSNYSGATVVSGGATLDLTTANLSTGSFSIDGSSTLNLALGNIVNVAGLASFAGTLNVTGSLTSSPEVLMTYNASSNTFGTANVPAGDTLVYAANALEVTGASAGAANLTWNAAGGPGNGTTWDTTQANWNNGMGAVAYSDTSNGSTGDMVTFNDNNNGSYGVTVVGLVHPTSVTFNASAGNYTLTGTNSSSGIAGTTSLLKIGAGTLTLAINDSYTGGTNIANGKLVLASANAFPTNTSLIVGSGATVQVANHGANATYVPIVSSLSNSGRIDLVNNAMVLKGANGSIGSIQGQVAAGFNGGTWNNSGAIITSSMAAADTKHLTAVGTATGFTSFEGNSVSASDVLLKYTYYGDANLDGKVDGSDYSRIDNGYLTHLTGWWNGDFNYDGVVNGSDYTLIDNAYNTQGAQLASEIASPTAQIAGGTSAVPEPASLGLLTLGAFGLLGRRHRNKR